MLFGWDLSINALYDFTQTAYADGNMQNAMGACRKKNYHTFLKQKAWKFSIVSVSWRLHYGWHWRENFEIWVLQIH